ncbi:MAG TPA: DUF1345 domain-containing protein, partial [Sphingomonas sp.]|nr:DUF1345 domain-containing protein [Sphingomonas sp.]
MNQRAGERRAIGNRIAPPRFLLFVAASALGLLLAVPPLGWRFGAMAAFDAGATLFLLAHLPLLGHEPQDMRRSAERNDANRLLLLLVTLAVTLAVLAAVASVLHEHGTPHLLALALVVATLALCWCFSNTVYALHYAHLFYTRGAHGGDAGGLEFPDTPEPDYWDFVYF